MIREWFVSVFTEAIAKAIFHVSVMKVHPLEEAHLILGDYEVSITRRRKR